MKQNASIGSTPLFDLTLLHLSIRLEILLVAEDEKWKVLRVFGHTLLQEIGLPTVQVLEALVACDVEHENASLCTSIERSAKTLVPLLARCIP